MNPLNCVVGNNETPTAITVGQKFSIACSGDEVQWDKQKLVILKKDKTEDPMTNDLAILQVTNIAPSKIDLLVTSYKPGSYKVDDYILTDKVNSAQLSGFTYDVKSVIPQGAQPTPFAPYGPWTLSVGIVYWLILLVIIGGICYEAYREFKKWKTRKRLIEELKNYKTARSPYDELHSDLRKLERNLELQKVTVDEFLASLERSYRLYLIRELEVPALDWADKEIVKEVKRRHKKIYLKIKKDLVDYFAEIRKIKKTVKREDAGYLIKGCQNISDKISDLKIADSKVER